MALHPFADINIHTSHFQVLEQFTVFLFDKTSDVEQVNEARKVLFFQNEKNDGKTTPDPGCPVATHQANGLSSWNMVQQ